MSRHQVADYPAMREHQERIRQAVLEGIGPGMHKVLGGGRVLYCNPRGSWIEVTAEDWRKHNEQRS